MSTKFEKMYNCAIPALNRMHDKGIELHGQEVSISIPDPSSRDIYGVHTAEDTTELITQLLIDWSAWRFVLSSSNAGEEFSDLPVVATAKIDVSIPIGSIIKIQVEHFGISQEFNTFMVINNEILSTTIVYGRRLTMVPQRGTHY